MFLEKEIWVSVHNADNYLISNLGNIRTKNRYITDKNGNKKFFKSKYLIPTVNSRGYYHINIKMNDNKYHVLSIHRLVAEHFIPNPSNLPEVNHKDENKLNCKHTNLEWCNRSYNLNYGNRNDKVRKTLGKKVLCIETNIIYDSIHEAGIKNNIRPAMISRCCNGNRKTVHGYHWKFI